MEFETEYNLVTFFKEHFITSLGIEKNAKILEEVKLGFGIPDLVISELSNSSFYLNNARLNTVDIGIYKIIEKRKKVTVDTIANITRCNKRQINESLIKLSQREYIEKQNLYYILSNSYKLSFKKSIAIEAKLKNWKRALMQAYRYKWFADYSYVVLDNAHCKPAIGNLDLFKKYNVGLITISLEGIFIKHYIPRKEKPIDEKMQILLSETLIL